MVNFCCFFRCDQDGNNHIIEEIFSNKKELDFPVYTNPPTSAAKQMMPFTNITKKPAGFTASAERQNASHSTSPPSAQSASSKERQDMEMSVLRRQEAVLKLQEEYYTLKIKLMKKQMEALPQKD